MLSKLLPTEIYSKLVKIGLNNIYEVRLRRFCPIVVNVLGKNKLLLNDDGQKIYVNNSIIENTLRIATENSLYAFNNQVKQGFITAIGGYRLGIAGESVVSDSFVPTTIKNIHSISIRIPHEVIDCSKKIFGYICNLSGIKNTLIISPPGAGKTTLLRDIARKLCHQEKIVNIMIVDERYEIASCENGKPFLNVGEFCDIVSGGSKKYAFENGIRSLKPDVVLTDELMGKQDAEACKMAMRSGIKVIATIHASNHFELLDKEDFKELINGKYFERFIVLSNRDGAGSVEGIFDENLKCIYY